MPILNAAFLKVHASLNNALARAKSLFDNISNTDHINRQADFHPTIKFAAIGAGGKFSVISGFWEAPPVLYKPRWNPFMSEGVVKGY